MSRDGLDRTPNICDISGTAVPCFWTHEGQENQSFLAAAPHPHEAPEQSEHAVLCISLFSSSQTSLYCVP